MRQQEQTNLLRDRYTTALLAGDEQEAARVVSDALERRIRPEAIHLEILSPSLAEIGQAWERGDVNIAQEHLATSVTLDQMAHVRDSVRRSDDVSAEVLVAAVEGELHFVATRMLADLFYFDGWNVSHLGANTPADDLAELAHKRQSELVVLSFSHPDREPIARRAVALLKALDHRPAVFVGGRGLSPVSDELQRAADLVSSNPLEALRTARELLGLKRERPTLEMQLKALGERVQELRKARGWSQQRLANAAGLDRTYLGTVEQGRQNITIGAALKLADAFEIPLVELIDPR